MTKTKLNDTKVTAASARVDAKEVPAVTEVPSKEVRSDSVPAEEPASGQIWRNRGGELVAIEAAMAGAEDRLYCRFLQPRHAPSPGYLVDHEGRYFSRSFIPPQGDNPFDLVTLVERSLSEKAAAARTGPTIGFANDEDPARVMELFEKIAAVMKAKGKGGKARLKRSRVEVERGVFRTNRSTVTSWQLDKVSYEEDRTPMKTYGKPASDLVMRNLTVSVDSRRPDGWWSVNVFDSKEPYLTFFNGSVGEFFMLAGILLPKENLFTEMRGEKSKKRVAKKRKKSHKRVEK